MCRSSSTMRMRWVKRSLRGGWDQPVVELDLLDIQRALKPPIPEIQVPPGTISLDAVLQANHDAKQGGIVARQRNGPVDGRQGLRAKVRR